MAEVIDDMFIYCIEFPRELSKEHEMVVPCLDGYTIYININLDEQGRRKALEHAKEHIRSGDVDRHDGDVQQIEARAHGIKPEVRKMDPETSRIASIWHRRWVESHKRYVAYLEKELNRERRMAQKNFFYDQVEDALDRREKADLATGGIRATGWLHSEGLEK